MPGPRSRPIFDWEAIRELVQLRRDRDVQVIRYFAEHPDELQRLVWLAVSRL